MNSLKRCFVGLTLLLLMMGGWLATAQDAGWQVVFLETEGRLLYVTADGITREVVLPGLADLGATQNARLSPDGTRLLVAANNAEGAGLYVADVAGETCCTRLFSPTPIAADIVQIGPFSPDGSQVATIHSTVSGDEGGQSGTVVIYDLLSGEIVHTLSTLDLPDSTPQSLSAFLGQWTDAGIEIAAATLGADQAARVNFSLWNPADNTISPDAGIYEAFGVEWPPTNEVIVAERDENYPTGDTLQNNVIRYYADSTQNEEPVMIYARAGLFEVNWIIGGDALYIRHVPEDVTYLLLRDGSLGQIEVSPEATYLSATPDGWLLRDADAILHYQLTPDVLNTFELGRASGRLTVVQPAAYDLPEGGSFPILE